MSEAALTFIFPNQKRLMQVFMPIAEAAGLRLSKAKERQDFGRCTDLAGEIAEFEACIRRPGDAIRKLLNGKADLAVMGVDKFVEARCKANEQGRNFDLRVAGSFNSAVCSMYVAAAPETGITSPADLEGLRIATPYPYSLKAWLKEQGVRDFEVIACEGGTEDEIRDGSADAIFEIVDSGRTLDENGLERKIRAYDTEAVLIERKSMRPEIIETATKVKKRLAETAKGIYSTCDEKGGNDKTGAPLPVAMPAA